MCERATIITKMVKCGAMPKRIKTVRPQSSVAHIRSTTATFETRRRGTAHERGYDSRWQRTRIGFLRKHPLCVSCQAHDHPQPADTVDHIIPHRGDKQLFWQRANWQALCEWCHNNIKAGLDRKYIAGRLDPSQLNLARRTDGWQHPADR